MRAAEFFSPACPATGFPQPGQGGGHTHPLTCNSRPGGGRQIGVVVGKGGRAGGLQIHSDLGLLEDICLLESVQNECPGIFFAYEMWRLHSDKAPPSPDDSLDWADLEKS